MRVLQLGPYPPPHGGIQTHLVALREFLLQRQIPCPVINLTRYRRAEVDDVYYPRSAFQVLWLLLTLRYDVAHLHIGGNIHPRLFALCLACCLIPRTRVVLTLHSGGYPSSPKGRTAHSLTLRGFILRLLDGLIAVNPEIVQLFHRFGVRPDRIRLISPYALPRHSPHDSLPLPMQTFLRRHNPVLTTVGGLEPEYDLPIQIEVLGRIRAGHPKAGLLIVGSGSLERQLLTRVGSQPYADHILVCGAVPHRSALCAIAQSDMFLRTTQYDGDSIAVREALHLGVPVIATDNGMRPEGVELIPASDLEALEKAIEMRLAQPRRRQKQDSEADAHNLTAVLHFYEQICDDGGAPRRG